MRTPLPVGPWPWPPCRVLSLGTPVGLFVAGPVAGAAGLATWFLISGLLILAAGVWMFVKSRAL